jgi:hypothetical protein
MRRSVSCSVGKALLAQHLLLAHFGSDACPREPHQFGKRCIRARMSSKDKAGIAYCRGGIGARDDGGAVGTRDDDGDAAGLRVGATGGCGGGSGIFKSISATADSSLAMSRAIEC